jgi:mannosyltransferase OCH1-like enzyme
MYAEGGIYLDIKSSLTRSLNEVISSNDQYILSHWENQPGECHDGWGMRHQELKCFKQGEYQQWHIITVKGHPYLKKIILQVIDNIKQYNILRDDSGRKGVIKMTGPIVYTQQIESIKHLYPFREVNIKQDFGIEYSIYQSLDNKKNHHHIFKKHYSKNIRPVVKPEKIADYSVLPFFYLKKYLMKFISFLLTMSKKQHFPT